MSDVKGHQIPYVSRQLDGIHVGIWNIYLLGWEPGGAVCVWLAGRVERFGVRSPMVAPAFLQGCRHSVPIFSPTKLLQVCPGPLPSWVTPPPGIPSRPHMSSFVSQGGGRLRLRQTFANRSNSVQFSKISQLAPVVLFSAELWDRDLISDSDLF